MYRFVARTLKLDCDPLRNYTSFNATNTSEHEKKRALAKAVKLVIVLVVVVVVALATTSCHAHVKRNVAITRVSIRVHVIHGVLVPNIVRDRPRRIRHRAHWRHVAINAGFIIRGSGCAQTAKLWRLDSARSHKFSSTSLINQQDAWATNNNWSTKHH